MATPTSIPAPSDGLTYRNAGVDVDAGNALVDAIKGDVARTQRPGVMGGFGGFGGLFDLKAAGFADPILVAGTDGVGTKLRVAIDAGTHTSVGIDLVAMCVNDLIVQGAEPLFFLDYYATGTLDVTVATDVVQGIAAGCQQANCALLGGETAEMPGHYRQGDYDLAGFCLGAVERDALLPRTDVQAGDVLLALGSNGLHSNGFSLVRKVIDRAGWSLTAPAPWTTETPDQPTLAQALLTPTRIYVRPLLDVLKGPAGPGLKALAHITGGGLTENIPRVLPDHCAAAIDLAALTPAPVFGALASAGGIAEDEMLRTFNCGVGMVCVVAASAADEIAEQLRSAGEQVTVIGTLIHRSDLNDPQVQYSGASTFALASAGSNAQ